MVELKLVTYNVNGLNAPTKRSMLIAELKKARAQVIFLQETHFQTGKTPRIQPYFFPHVYNSDAKDTKTKGASILLARTVLWDLIDIASDEEGRWVMVKGKCFGELCTFVSIYAPNKRQVDFLEELLKRLDDFAEGLLIIGGDMNLVLEPETDTSTGTDSITQAKLQRIKTALYERQLCNSWRLFNPTIRDYTYFSPVYNRHSRIDLFLMRH